MPQKQTKNVPSVPLSVPLSPAIHEREGGRCFYCSRRITHHRRCLDHVVPRAELGQNLVSCCLECNSNKAERPAEEFLCWLYRDRRLSADELTGRLRALDDLAAGKLIPPLPARSQGVSGRQHYVPLSS